MKDLDEILEIQNLTNKELRKQIQLIEGVKQAKVNAYKVKEDEAIKLTAADKKQAIADEATFQKELLQIKDEIVRQGITNDFDRSIVKLKQQEIAREKEINALKISGEKKTELLALEFEKNEAAVNALIDKKQEKDQEQTLKNEQAKRELLNQIELENAETAEEKSVIKAEQDLDKQLLKLEQLKLDTDEYNTLKEELEMAASERIAKIREDAE